MRVILVGLFLSLFLSTGCGVDLSEEDLPEEEEEVQQNIEPPNCFYGLRLCFALAEPFRTFCVDDWIRGCGQPTQPLPVAEPIVGPGDDDGETMESCWAFPEPFRSLCHDEYGWTPPPYVPPGGTGNGGNCMPGGSCSPIGPP